MIKLPPKLYLKRKDIPIQSLLDMAEDQSDFSEAGVYRKDFRGVDKNTRSTKLKKDIKPKDYPDICKYLLEMVSIWNGTLDPNDYKVQEFNYLKYEKGDHFTRHKDILPDGERIFSTSTIITKSDDLKGGDFVIFQDDGYFQAIDLDIGETVFFSSETHHQIDPVISGTREVLVAWIWKKTEKEKQLEREVMGLREQERRMKQQEEIQTM